MMKRFVAAWDLRDGTRELLNIFAEHEVDVWNTLAGRKNATVREAHSL